MPPCPNRTTDERVSSSLRLTSSVGPFCGAGLGLSTITTAEGEVFYWSALSDEHVVSVDVIELGGLAEAFNGATLARSLRVMVLCWALSSPRSEQ